MLLGKSRPLRLRGRWAVREHAVSASPQEQPAPAHLGPVVAEDAHHADRNSFVQTAPQSLAVESEHKGDVLFTGVIDDGVQGVVQSTCPREGMGMTGGVTGPGGGTGCKGFCYTQQHCQLPRTRHSPKTTPPRNGCVYAESTAALHLMVLAHITDPSQGWATALPASRGSSCLLTKTQRGGPAPLTDGSQEQRGPWAPIPHHSPPTGARTGPAPGEAPPGPEHRQSGEKQREPPRKVRRSVQRVPAKPETRSGATTTQSLHRGVQAAPRSQPGRTVEKRRPFRQQPKVSTGRNRCLGERQTHRATSTGY